MGSGKQKSEQRKWNYIKEKERQVKRTFSPLAGLSPTVWTLDSRFAAE